MPTIVLVLSLIFAAFGLLYIVLIPRLPYNAAVVFKPIPMLCLAGIALQYVPGTIGLLLFVGFLFSAMGDEECAQPTQKEIVAFETEQNVAHCSTFLPLPPTICSAPHSFL